MNKLAVIVIGQLQCLKELVEEVETLLKKNSKYVGNNITIFLVDSHLTSDHLDYKHFSSHFNCEIKLITSTETSPIGVVYELKTELDDLDILDSTFILPSANCNVFESVCKYLFPPIYSIVTYASVNVKSSEYSIVPSEASVASFLSSVPSTNKKDVSFLHSKLIPQLFVHGYSSRDGGISTHCGLSSLNLCYSLKKRDSKLVIMENRARLCHAAKIKAEKLFLAKAVHGNDVWVFEEKEPNSYDAIITKTPGIFVAAPGADCNMILFADPVRKTCGAAHAGWKGILCGIIEATVKAMVEKYATDAKDLLVSIGPSLNSCCCEFSVEESKKFLRISEKCVVWKEGAPKPFLDLRLASKILLLQCGVLPQNVDDGENSESDLRICTKCDPKMNYYSFRRIGSQFGNQVGFIGLFEDNAQLVM